MRDLPEELCKTDWMLTDLMPKLHIQVSTLHTHTNINTYIHTCMHACMRTDRQTDREPASQPARQTDIYIYTYTCTKTILNVVLICTYMVLIQFSWIWVRFPMSPPPRGPVVVSDSEFLAGPLRAGWLAQNCWFDLRENLSETDGS